MAGGPNPELRKTALKVLGRLGPAAAPALLTALRKEPATEERTIVLDGLRAMPGSVVDGLLLQALISARPGTQIDLIRLLDTRNVDKASGEILKLATGPDREVSMAALSALKSLAGPAELPGLIAFSSPAKTKASGTRLKML